jgi:quinoprotein glucose dehydrogenase
MTSFARFSLALLAFSAGAAGGEPVAHYGGTAGGEPWAHYGGDAGGQRYSDLRQLTPENVDRLEVAWTHRSGDWRGGRGKEARSEIAYEATPILVDGTLYVCTPFNRVIALDPATGEERWVFDPEIDLGQGYANQAICRGVSHWRDPGAEAGVPCGRRIFTGTNDARLIAIDAVTGARCADFGRDGEVDLTEGVGEIERAGFYQVTSHPLVAGDVIAVGTAIADNQTTRAPSGVVRGFDARSGALRWAFDPVRKGFEGHEDFPKSDGGFYLGTANVWAPMSYDAARDLVFVPTGNTSPDYYGGHRRGLDEYAASVLALRGATGELVWHFATVHNDVWDFDVPAQPTLTEITVAGERVPVVVQATKMGFLFVLHRETGEPVFGVEERPVPQGGVPGEKISPTQPFPVKPPPLVDLDLELDDAWGLTPFDRRWCRNRLEQYRSEGIYTPPSLQGSIMYPGNAGGSNWGGIAVDPGREIAIANVMNAPWVVTLFPADEFAARKAAEPGVEISPQRGTPYGMRRTVFLSPLGLPCTAPPWGELVAVDLSEGEILWRIPFGTTRDVFPVPIALEYGLPNLGGPFVTASGLLLIGASYDDYLRAYDTKTGEELWKGRLPAGGQATPMTYEVDGRQFVVIAAGGHERAGTTPGDHLVAFALPEN